MSSPVLLFDGPEEAPLTLALAHGAGAPMDSPFMNFFARQLGEGGLRVARFEFPYMTARRESGVQRPPDRLPILEETWRAVIADLYRSWRIGEIKPALKQDLEAIETHHETLPWTRLLEIKKRYWHENI